MTLPGGAAALLLAASLLPVAAGVVNDVPAEIDVTTTLNCDTNFLSLYGLLIGGGGVSGGTPPSFTFADGPCAGRANSDPHLSGNAPANLVPGSGGVSALAKLRVFSAFGYNHSINIPGDTVGCFLDYDLYNLFGTLALQNGETYFLAPFDTGGPLAQILGIGGVIPLAPDPNYTPPNANRYGTNYVTDTETPGVLSITLQCPDGSPAPAGIQGSMFASLNDGGGVQARLPSFNTSSSPTYLLVRSGHNYSLNLTYTTGSDPASDLITWPISIPNVPINPSDTVQGCVTNPVIAKMLSCDIGNPFPCGGATITGFVDMLGEAANWPGNFSMEAFPGPAGNFRTGRIHLANPAPYDNFDIINVVPSGFFVPYGYPDQPYSVGGQLCFGKNSDYEYFQTPHTSAEAIDCQSNNLGQVFLMCPGHVQGNLSLTGPVYGSATPSPWQSLVLDRTFGSNGHDDANPYLAPIPFTGTSYIGANQGDGAARVLFSAQTSADGSTLSGSYDLRLAGLSSPVGVPSSSSWNPNLLNLNFNSPSTVPADNIQENLQITDNNYTGVTIVCGATNHHDITNCFGDVTLKIVDTDPGDTSYQSVSVSGDIDPTSGSSYSAHFSASGVVVPPTSATPNASGLIRLFLPQGLYNIVTTVTTATGSYNQPASTLAVSCGSIEDPHIPGSPVFSLSDMPTCSSVSNVSATLTFYSPQTPTNTVVSYTVNGVTVVICGGVYTCLTSPLTIYNIPLQPCRNVIEFKVTDKTTHLSSVVTKIVYCFPTPPTVACSDIVLQMPSGQSAVTVDYNNVSVAGGCFPWTLSFDPPNHSSFPVGSTPVTCAFGDACNSNFCTFNVIVQPTPPPCMVITNESFICNSNGLGGYYYNFTVLSAPDPIFFRLQDSPSSCVAITHVDSIVKQPDAVEVQVALNITPGCSQPFCLTISIDTNINGLFTCSVQRCFDNPNLLAPDCPTNIVVDCTNDSGAYVNYALPAGAGLCCPPVIVTAYPPPGNFPIGVTPVTCTASDSCGHTNTCQFSVTVRGHSSNRDQPRNLRHDGLLGDIQMSEAIAVDAEGNSFITGWFSSTAHFGNTILTSLGGKDIFLAKFGPDLSGPLWVQHAGGPGDDQANAVAVDSQGNCYIAGVIASAVGVAPVGFLNSPLNNRVTWIVPPANMFLAKYDPDGNLLWVAPADGQSGGNAEGLAIDGNDNCYVCGGYGSFAVFESASGVTGDAVYVYGYGQSDAYIVKYNPSGTPQPQWPISSSGFDSHTADARGIAIDRIHNKVVVTGEFSGAPTFGDTTLGPTPPDAFQWAFVAQCDLSTSPDWTWARQTFSPPPSFQVGHDGRQIGVDNAGNCYFTAYFNGQASIADNNQTAAYTVTPSLSHSVNLTNPYNDYLVGSFGPTGIPRWLINGNSSGDDESRALAVRPDTGDVFVTGFLKGLDRDADGGLYVMLRHYDNLGIRQVLAEHSAYGTSKNQSNAGRGLAIDAAGCIYMTGSYTDTRLDFVDFQNSQNNPIYLLNALDGTPKTFIAKYCPLCEECILPGVVGLPPDVFTNFGPAATYPVSYTITASGAPPLTIFWTYQGNLGSVFLDPNGGPCYSITVNGNTSTLTLTCALAGACATCPYSVLITNACGTYGAAAVAAQLVIDPNYNGGNHTNGIPLNISLPRNLFYIVQYRDDLGPGGIWIDLTSGISSGIPTRVVDPNPNPIGRFYRLSFPDN